MSVFGIEFLGEEKMDKDFSMDYLIMTGVIEIAGIDEKTGEFLYVFTDKLQEVMPDLYAEHLNYVHSEIMYFWEHGFVDIEDFSIKNPKICLTEKAFDEDAIDQLPNDKISALLEIKRILKVV